MRIYEKEYEELLAIADKNNDGSLSLEELRQLFHKINLYIADPKWLAEEFQKVDTENKGTITIEQYKILIGHFQERKAIDYLYQTVVKLEQKNTVQKNLYDALNSLKSTAKLYFPQSISYYWPGASNEESSTNNLILESQFREFLERTQKETGASVDEIVKEYVDKNGYISHENFMAYFLEDRNRLYNFKHRQANTVMDKPWTEYFMNSSHNTYLEGNQLTGRSSTDAYKVALQLGARCIELDCFDNGSDEPIVKHGYTLTSKVSFRDIIQTVKENAFLHSPYPVVLSLEVHCGLDGQKQLAMILHEVLGDFLLHQSDTTKDIPSPEDLKHKIIVQGVAFDENEEEAAQGLAKELANLAIYQRIKKVKTIEHCEKESDIHVVLNVSEGNATKMILSDPNQLIQANNKCFSRIYPEGTRVGSSNYNPLQFWQAGCQIAALNFQKYDRHLQINQGMFRQNNNLGYVLKPEYMRGATIHQAHRKKISVSVISGYRFPKPRDEEDRGIIDPYITVELTVPNISKNDLLLSEQFSTRPVKSNGFNPLWFDENTNGELFKSAHLYEFSTIVTLPELSFLQFTVSSRNLLIDEFCAAATIPVDCLKSGYRVVTLSNYKCQLLDWSYLFVYVDVQDL
ncbi:PLC-like phosphodiesterase [Globomyces pollinis-pini]|nr:PLC-like phosphodiesterase [Globomyces pollinis-pini]